jgi:hypothetical protein
MALSPGTRFGAYEVTAPLGQGGMGVLAQLRTEIVTPPTIDPSSFALSPD